MRNHKFITFFFITKFHLLRMRKGINSPKFLSKLENKIVNELHQFNPEISFVRMRSQKLILRPGSKNKHLSTVRRLRLTWRLRRTRGQMRWVCYSLFSPVLDNAYQISQAKLILLIARNWTKFSEEVLSCLTISNEDTSHLKQVSLYQFINPIRTGPLDINLTYLLEGEYNRRLIYRSDKSLSKFTLARIIMWNSSCARAFIQQSATLKTSDQLHMYLEEVFPDFKDLLSSRVSLKIVFHPNCNKTFDQITSHGVLAAQDEVTDVEIWHQRFIIKNKSWLVIDSTSSPRLKFVAGQWQFLEQTKSDTSTVEILGPKNAKKFHLSEAIFLMGRVDENWYHLILDTLPRYLLIKEIKPEVPVLIRGDLPQTSRILVERLIGREIIYVQPEDLVTVRTLYFISARSTVYDSAPEESDERVSYSPTIMQKQSEWMLQGFPLKDSQVFPRKILINRQAKYRNLLNMGAVSRLLKRNDFQVFEPDESFYLNQGRFFSEANVIASPGGAVMANMIFMQPGSSVLLMRSWRDSDLLLWKKLAEACGVHFNEAIGIPSYHGRNRLARQHSNFYLPLRRVRKLLNSGD
jgi:hypothetical protein